MSRFSKYRPKGYKFIEPERLSSTEINSRRIARFLKDAEQAHNRALLRELSPASQSRFSSATAKYGQQSLGQKPISDNRRSPQNVRGNKLSPPQQAARKALLLRPGHPRDLLKQFVEADFADPQLRQRYRELRRSQGGQRKVSPTGTDSRQFNPTGKSPNTIYGTAARFGTILNPALGWVPFFQRATRAIPCIQRQVRREVMFAKKKAGKGYHTRKRRTENSGVPC